MPNVQHAHHRDATPNRTSRPRRCSAPRNRIINRKIILKYPCQRKLCQEHPPKNAMPKNSYITVPCPAKWRATLPHCHATLPRAPCPAQPSPTQPSPAQGCVALPVSVLPCPLRNLHNKENMPHTNVYPAQPMAPCLALPSPAQNTLPYPRRNLHY